MITKSFTFAGLSLILLLASLSQAENNCAPLPPGLIAWWPGDGFALDVVSTNDGALRNGATFAPGKVGQAFRFDGVDDLVEIPNVAALGFAPGTSGTLEFWLYRTKASLPIHFLGKRSGCYDNAGINYQSAIDYNNPPFPLNTWIHWVQVYRPDGVYIYTNGILYGYSPGATFGSKNSATLRIGTSDDCPGQGFGGLIDEVSIYNRALSAGEISGIYSAGDAGKCYSNNPAPAFLRQPTTQTQYAGMSMGLDGFAMGNPRPVFQWLKDGVPIPRSTNPILNFASLDSANSGAYALMASNI